MIKQLGFPIQTREFKSNILHNSAVVFLQE